MLRHPHLWGWRDHSLHTQVHSQHPVWFLESCQKPSLSTEPAGIPKHCWWVVPRPKLTESNADSWAPFHSFQTKPSGWRYGLLSSGDEFVPSRLNITSLIYL